MDVIQRERRCWHDAVEDFDTMEQWATIPMSLSNFENSFPKVQGARTILIDFGARSWRTSSSTLVKIYGAYGVRFDHIYAVEAAADRVETFVADARSSADLEIKKAISNATIDVLVNIVATEGNKHLGFGHRGHKAFVETLDPVKFLREMTKVEDFVVVKMDIEMAEYDVIPHMCQGNAFKFVDEFFVEVHFLEPERHACHPPFAACSKKEAAQMIAGLRRSGVAAHLWI